ncbi:MAG: hypothetical protein M3O70_17145 [Actinomycetota bacterium]|nr:hypothetical protein [Actinomycetota bacterium]
MSRWLTSVAYPTAASGALLFPSTDWWLPVAIPVVGLMVGAVLSLSRGLIGVLVALGVAGLVLLPSYWGNFICPPDLPGCSRPGVMGPTERDIPLALVGVVLPEIVTRREVAAALNRAS